MDYGNHNDGRASRASYEIQPLTQILLFTSSFFVAALTMRGETIQQGINSISPAAPATPVAGTIDSAYITAVFGTNDYIQDSSGGTYAFAASSGTSTPNGALRNLTIGTQVFGLTTGSFSLFTNASATNSQFEYTPVSSITSSTAGTVSSIPAAFYQTETVSAINANQGGLVNGAIVQGLQNNLVTINNATIETSTGGAITAGTTFTASGTYRIADSTGFAALFIYNSTTQPNSTNSLVGTVIPTGPVNVSGIDAEFTNAPEIQPRGTFDITSASVPEPSTYVAASLTVAVGAFGFLRRRKV